MSIVVINSGQASGFTVSESFSGLKFEAEAVNPNSSMVTHIP